MNLSPQAKKLKRIRDGKIVLLWVRHNWSTEKIAEKFNLSQRRIEQILYENHNFVDYNKDWEKKKRIQRIQKWIEKAPDPELNKLSLQQELRSELEGAQGTGGNGETKIIIIRPEDKAPHSNKRNSIEDDNGGTSNRIEGVSRSISI